MRQPLAFGSVFALLFVLLCCSSCGHTLDGSATRGLVHLRQTENGAFQLMRDGEVTVPIEGRFALKDYAAAIAAAV